jgi:hypothetical protein
MGQPEAWEAKLQSLAAASSIFLEQSQPMADQVAMARVPPLAVPELLFAAAMEATRATVGRAVLEALSRFRRQRK